MSNLSSEEYNGENVKEALYRENFSLEPASSKNSNRNKFLKNYSKTKEDPTSSQKKKYTSVTKKSAIRLSPDF